MVEKIVKFVLIATRSAFCCARRGEEAEHAKSSFLRASSRLRPFARTLALLLASAPLIAQINYTAEAAQTALDAEKYREATTILDSLERTGQVSAPFYLALGNARFQAGEIGSSILAYERGLRLKPGQKDLANNLRFVREEAGITRPTLPGFFLLRWWHWLGAALGTTMAYVLSLVFWWAAIAGALYWYLQRKQMEEKRRFALLPVAVACIGLAVLFFALGQSRFAYLNNDNEAILIAPTATMRVAPTPDGSVEAELEQGWKVFITDRVNGWVKVVLGDGRTGYLEEEVVGVI